MFGFKILKFVDVHWKYPALANFLISEFKIFDLNSNIYVRTALFACVQHYLCACNVIYVHSMLIILRCQINVPLLIIIGKFEDQGHSSLPPPRVINFHNSPRCILKKLTFIRQHHIGVLFQILCILLEQLTLGECLYIWKII